jgi:hypothetical protein
MDEQLDTTNRFAVGSQGGTVRIGLPCGVLTKDDALNLAAYLVAITDPTQAEFTPLLKAILST